MNDTWWIKEEQLDEDQKVFAGLGPTGNHLITGPPGCGKTNLLLLRAKYMYRAGQTNILVIVFTKTLQEFIQHGSNAYGLPGGVVLTLGKWQRDFLRENGVKFKPTGSFEEQREQLADEIAKLIDAKKMGKTFDAIFLDEAQDYLPAEIEAFGKLGKTLTAAADIHQKIYDVDCMEEIRKIIKQEHPMRYHYRLGRKICILADGMKKNSAEYQPLLPTCNYNEPARPSSVELIPCQTFAEQTAKIVDKVRVQLKAYPDELLGILCPKNEELDRVWDAISKTDLAPLCMKQGGGDHSAFDDTKTIHVGNIHSAKGVEFRTVHLAYAESLKDFSYGRNIAFTAVTRAKTSLSIYHIGPIPGYLRQAFTELQPLPKLPTVKDLFGNEGMK